MADAIAGPARVLKKDANGLSFVDVVVVDVVDIVGIEIHFVEIGRAHV